MKRLALVAGVAFLLLGIAGFAGLLALNPVHCAIYAGVGVLGIIFGLTHRSRMVPPQGPRNDMRDFV